MGPKPDPELWSKFDDPVLRLRTALTETYAWARPAAPMMTKIFQDLDALPDFVSQFLAADERLRVAVVRQGSHTPGRGVRRVDAALAHALRLGTWESLCLQGDLTDPEAINIMIGAVLAAIPPKIRTA